MGSRYGNWFEEEEEVENELTSLGSYVISWSIHCLVGWMVVWLDLGSSPGISTFIFLH